MRQLNPMQAAQMSQQISAQQNLLNSRAMHPQMQQGPSSADLLADDDDAMIR